MPRSTLPHAAARWAWARIRDAHRHRVGELLSSGSGPLPFGESGPEPRQEEMTGPLGTASNTTALTVTILSQSKEYLSNTAALVIPRLMPLLTR